MSKGREKQCLKPVCASRAGAPIGSVGKSRHCGLWINLHFFKKSACSKADTNKMTRSTLRETEQNSALAQHTEFKEKGMLWHETMGTETKRGRTVIKGIWACLQQGQVRAGTGRVNEWQWAGQPALAPSQAVSLLENFDSRTWYFSQLKMPVK